jgi:TPR repeat protein
LYKAAIEFGIPDGYLGMAGWYMTGAQGHLQKDEIKAFALVKKASESGLARGQFTLGYFYDQGIGIEKNDAEAIRHFKLAADQGMFILI